MMPTYKMFLKMYWQGSKTSVLDTVGKTPDFSSNVIWYCLIVPASLSNWASYHDIPIPALGYISDDDFQSYSSKGANIQSKGLADDMTTAWDSIPSDSRLLIINMWVSRPESRRDISHPTPTIDQAERLVEADSNLTPQEVALAKNIIRTAVDQNYVPLFRNTESSMD